MLWDIYAGTGRVFPASGIFSFLFSFPDYIQNSLYAQFFLPAISYIEKHRNINQSRILILNPLYYHTSRHQIKIPINPIFLVQPLEPYEFNDSEKLKSQSSISATPLEIYLCFLLPCFPQFQTPPFLKHLADGRHHKIPFYSTRVPYHQNHIAFSMSPDSSAYYPPPSLLSL